MTSSEQQYIEISIKDQKLSLMIDSEAVFSCSVSTALNGTGQITGSGCTPLGKHKIRMKIGEGCPVNSVFIGRRPTGEIYSSGLASQYPDRDWILTRILWLTGCDSGINRGGKNDTLRRFIYIHGTPDSEPMGKPLSHGCVRMRNDDIVKLFDMVDPGLMVMINA